MAQGTTVYGGRFMVKLGDAGTPETFKLMGGFESKNFSKSGASSSFQVPDNDNPDIAVWDETIITSLSATLDCDGFLESEFIADWDKFFDDAVTRNLQLRFDAPAAIAGRTYSGRFVCTKNDQKATIKKKIMCSISLKSDGPLVISTT